jgi:hypothetical protein
VKRQIGALIDLEKRDRLIGTQQQVGSKLERGLPI